MTDDPNAFTEVYDVVTGVKHRVPAIWLGDAILGRNIRKTPAQRELDGDLPERPTEDSTIKEIQAYAQKAGIDLGEASKKTPMLSAIEDVFAHAEDQAGVVAVEPDPPVADPLAPQVAALVDSSPAPQTPDDPSADATDTGDAGQEN